MKYIYIINQFHLKEKAPLLIEKLETVSKQLHRDYEICVNATPEDVKKTLSAFKDSENIITCVGGDGSINLLLNDLIGTKNILSFIPQGTGNDFYHYCRDNLSDGFHDVDIIRINDRYFINVACFGIDADIANDDNFIHNRFIPRSMRYNAGVVYYFLTYKARAMKIKVNDQLIEKDFTTVVAGNAQYYGNGYHVTPNGDVKDGVMEVLLAGKVNKAAMAKLILSMKDSSHLKNPAVQTFSCRKLEVSADQPFQANIDGEPLKASRFELEVLPKGFRIYLDYDFINRIIQ